MEHCFGILRYYCLGGNGYPLIAQLVEKMFKKICSGTLINKNGTNSDYINGT